MGWFILAQLFSILIALVSLGRLSERENDLDTLLWKRVGRVTLSTQTFAKSFRDKA
jgi:hypothetical protein